MCDGFRRLGDRFCPNSIIIMLGAGGGTRTRTTFYSPGILSPVRLPFRHTGVKRRGRDAIITPLPCKRGARFLSHTSFLTIRHFTVVRSRSQAWSRFPGDISCDRGSSRSSL